MLLYKYIIQKLIFNTLLIIYTNRECSTSVGRSLVKKREKKQKNNEPEKEKDKKERKRKT